jgi:ferredoxin
MNTQDRVASIWARLDRVAAELWRLQAALWEIGSAPARPFNPTGVGVAQAPTGRLQAGTQSTPTAAARFTVMPQLCLGCGLCARIAPHTFTVNTQTGKAAVSDQGGDPPGLVQMAIARCPAGAIRYG